MTKKRAVKEAVSRAGGLTKLGRILGITPQAVEQWDQIPVGQVLKIEKALGIPRHEQRPDFYPPPSGAAA